MNQQKVLELALEALSPDPYKSEWVVQQDISKAITAIKEALAHPQQEAIYGMNPDDWKDLTDAVKKVRDGRGMYLACQPADVFQDWFLWLGTAKIKERT